MIRLSLWLPLELIVVCNSDGVAVGGKGGVAQLLFFFMSVVMHSTPCTCEFYDSICRLLRHCTLFFRQEVNFSCIKQAALLMGDEKKRKGISLPFRLAVHW